MIHLLDRALCALLDAAARSAPALRLRYSGDPAVTYRVEPDKGLITRCAACGEPVSYTDEGGCVGTDPAYHFRADCLLEACRRSDAQLQGAVEALRTLADLHHRTKVNSRLHDPENRDWTECECKSCRLAQSYGGGSS